MTHDTDSFIDEVTEEVRRDRLYLLMRRYGWIGLAVILVIVGGAAWREYASARDRAEAESWGDAVLAAQRSDDPVAALAALDPVGNADRGALGDLLTAGAALDAQDAATAGTHLESAATEAQDRALRDLARLKAVLAMGETMDPAARDANELAARTGNNRVVNFAGDASLIDTYVDVTITTALPHSLRGELAR